MSPRTYAIIVLVILVVVVILYDKFFSHKEKRKIASKEKYIKLNRQLNLTQSKTIDQFVDSTSSLPVSFGYKTGWLALKTTESEAVLNQLNKKNKPAFQTNWRKGVDGSYDGYCFISPPIDGWTLVLHPNLGNLSDKDTRSFLTSLSKEFGEAQFFGSHRVVSYAAWARFVDGEMIRAFSITDARIDMDFGDLTSLEDLYIEKEKKTMSMEELNYYQVEGFHHTLYGEDQVMEMAGLWSINPQNLDKYVVSSLGWIFEDF